MTEPDSGYGDPPVLRSVPRRDDPPVLKSVPRRGGVAALTPDAARALTDEVRQRTAEIWAKLLSLYEGGAHTALGYESWGAYFEAEFDQSYNYGYRLLKSAEVVAQLPMGNSQPSSERVARELVPVLLAEPEAVEGVWGEIVEQHGPGATAAQARAVVKAREAQAEAEVAARREAAVVDYASRKDARTRERAAQRQVESQAKHAPGKRKEARANHDAQNVTDFVAYFSGGAQGIGGMDLPAMRAAMPDDHARVLAKELRTIRTTITHLISALEETPMSAAGTERRPAVTEARSR